MPSCGTCRKTFDEGTTSCPDDGTELVPDELAPASPVLAAGTMVGDYRLESKIGEGAFGVVYAAEHPVIGKRAAIKVLDRKYCTDAAVVSRFITEARAVNRIRHPNIVDVFAFGKLGEQHFLAMELLEGTSLGSLLEHRGRLDPGEALPILRGIAEALDAAHAAGIVHRDLKPDNVFLVRSADGTVRPKLLDFGVAKLGGDGEVMHKTQTGTAVGTPLYMSPEQCRGKGVTGSSDVYALGAVAYQLLTGRPPFDGESVMDVLMAHITDTPPPISTLKPTLGLALDGVIASMLAKKPADRPASATDAIARLTEAAHAVERAPTLPAPAAATVRTPSAADATAADSGAGARPTLVTGEPGGEPRPTVLLEEARRAREAATVGKATLASRALAETEQSDDRTARATTGGKGETMSAIATTTAPRPRATSLWLGAAAGVVAVGAGLVWAFTPAVGEVASPSPEAEPRSPASLGMAPPRPEVQPETSAFPSSATEPPPTPSASVSASAAASTPATSPRPLPPGTLPGSTIPGRGPLTTPPATPGPAAPPAPSTSKPGPGKPGILDVRD